ncbi:MAG: hypothetical protein ACMG6H_03725, partial [Acidobacteriota bacterium]
PLVCLQADVFGAVIGGAQALRSRQVKLVPGNGVSFILHASRGNVNLTYAVRLNRAVNRTRRYMASAWRASVRRGGYVGRYAVR